MAVRASERRPLNLAPRIASAAVLVPVALAATYLGGWAFAALIVLTAALMVFEWDQLTGGDGRSAVGAAQGAGAIAAVVVVVLEAAGPALLCVAGGAAAAAALARRSSRSPAWAAGGAVYIGLPALCFVLLRGDGDLGLFIVLWIFAVVWATDIGGFAVGRLIGGPRLTRFSPNKTWAGLLGGMALAAVVSALFAATLPTAPIGRFAAFGAFAAVVAQAGDVGESWIKRRFGKKDSGTLIPGHGGILDRVDGLVTVVPLMVLMALIHPGPGLAWR